jgi:hypothetical protein
MVYQWQSGDKLEIKYIKIGNQDLVFPHSY